MKTIIDKIDAKMITSVGGILIAGLLAWILYKVLTNDLSHLNETLQGLNGSMQKNASVIEGNTEILRIIERRLK